MYQEALSSCRLRVITVYQQRLVNYSRVSIAYVFQVSKAEISVSGASFVFISRLSGVGLFSSILATGTYG